MKGCHPYKDLYGSGSSEASTSSAGEDGVKFPCALPAPPDMQVIPPSTAPWTLRSAPQGTTDRSPLQRIDPVGQALSGKRGVARLIGTISMAQRRRAGPLTRHWGITTPVAIRMPAESGGPSRNGPTGRGCWSCGLDGSSSDRVAIRGARWCAPWRPPQGAGLSGLESTPEDGRWHPRAGGGRRSEATLLGAAEGSGVAAISARHRHDWHLAAPTGGGAQDGRASFNTVIASGGWID